MPNYNNAEFLRHRFDSVLNQTLGDFEIIVCDSYSVDGAWRIIESYAAQHKRISAIQVPKEGIYAGWNECLSRASGEFVYIATSDDTMAPTCLEKLVAALNENPQCNVAMCGLDVINSNGQSLPVHRNWRSFPAGCFFESLFDTAHIRVEPLDGILSGSLHCIWHSTTQILVRRAVYERHGVYRCDLGSIADFEWNTRVALRESVVYIPEVLATLRVHDASASSQRGGYSTKDIGEKRRILGLLLDSLAVDKPELAERLRNAGWFDAFLFQEAIYLLKEYGLSLNCMVGLRDLWSISSRDKVLFLHILFAALRGKERVRRVFVDRLLAKLNMRLDDYIRPI